MRSLAFKGSIGFGWLPSSPEPQSSASETPQAGAVPAFLEGHAQSYCACGCSAAEGSNASYLLQDGYVAAKGNPQDPPQTPGGTSYPNYIDGITSGYYWNFTDGTRTITYSFQDDVFDAVDAADGFDDQNDWLPHEEQAFRDAFAIISSVINVDFAEIGRNDNNANFRLRNWNNSWDAWEANPPLANFNYPIPGSSELGVGNFNRQGTGFNAAGLVVGGYGFTTVIHELGHGLGLQHPFLDSEVNDFGWSNYQAMGIGSLDVGIFTVMSYSDRGQPWNSDADASGSTFNWPTYGQAGSMMAGDIAALQRVYGVRTGTGAGDTSYFLPGTFGEANASGMYYRCIWDTGGTDVISAFGATSAAAINLNPGQFISQLVDRKGGFTLAFDPPNSVTGGGSVNAWIENAVGGQGNDTIIGNERNNDLRGSQGNDAATGNEGEDTLWGGTGNDSLYGQTGNDTLRGEEDDDYILGQQDSDVIEGGSGHDTLHGDADGGSGDAADTISGGAGIDSIEGGDGNDSLAGDAGNDRISGEANADTIMGGAQSDVLAGGLDNDLIYGDDGLGGADLGDTILGEGGADTLHGGGGGDIIVGGDALGVAVDAADTIQGGAGGDTIDGGQGADSIHGEADNDSIKGGIDGDTIDGGFGDDTVLGGDGADSILGGAVDADQLSGEAGNDTIDAGSGNDTVTGGADNDSLAGNAGADNVAGDAGDDSVDGGGDNDTLSGGADKDTLQGGSGNDSLSGTAGDDSLEGGDGLDTLVGGDDNDVYILRGHESISETGTGNADKIEAFVGFTTSYDNIEIFQLVDAGDWVMVGNTIANTMIGNTGNDRLEGLGASDTLQGGSGNDTLVGGVAGDRMEGAAGGDLYVYEGGDTISDSSGSDTIETSVSLSLANPNFSGVDHLTATGSGNIDLTGDGGGNRLAGNDGVNTLLGLSGNDTILGGGAGDTINAGEDADSVEGGLGNDLIRGADAGSATDAGDTLKGGDGLDTILGEAGNDSIDGNLGNDSADGGGGNDTLIGGALDNDTLLGGLGDDSADGGSGDDSVSGGTGSDTVVGGAGDDTVTVGHGHGTASGDAGTDVLGVDYTGANYAIGSTQDESGDGFVGNTASSSFSRVTFTGFERFAITGGNHGDVLRGADLVDTLTGNAGDDHLIGGNGRDIIDGGDNNDRWEANLFNATARIDIDLHGPSALLVTGLVQNIEMVTLVTGSGSDLITTLGDFFGDTVSTGANNDVVEVAGGHDSVDAGAGAGDRLIVDYSAVTSYALTMTYDASTGAGLLGNLGSSSFSRVSFAGVERFALRGGAHGDSMLTGAGSDTLGGGAGDDVLNSGSGTDDIDGGDGAQDRWISNLSGQGTAVVLDLTLGENVLQNLANGGSVRGIEAVTLDTGGGADRIVTREDFFGDSVKTGAGDDTVMVAGGHDLAEAGAGDDLLIIDYSDITTYALGMGVDGDGRTIFGNLGSSSFSRVHYSGFERFLIWGGDHGDAIVTGSGNDTLDGNAGDDHLNSGSGIDAIDGGTGGHDRWEANIAAQSTAVILDLTLAEDVVNALANGGSIVNIEVLTLETGGGADNIVTRSDFFSDTVKTGAGDDTVSVAGGHDLIEAGDGDDLLIVDYSAITTYALGMGLDAEGRTIFGNLGSSSFSRVHYSGFERFRIFGGEHGDSIVTGAGNDTLGGNAGDDYLNSGSGVDAIDGGSGGQDRWEAVLSAQASAVVLDLTVAEGVANTLANGGSIKNIETLTLSTGIGADSIVTRSDFFADTLLTGGGNDTIEVAGGHDVVDGGAGANDLLIVDYSAVGSYGLGMTYDSLTGAGLFGNTGSSSFSRVSFTGVERFTLLGGSHGDQMQTGAGRDLLAGNGGDDALRSGSGIDTIQGGDGVDLWQADLSGQGSRVVLNLNRPDGSVTALANGGRVSGIEWLSLMTGGGADNIATRQEFYHDDVRTAGGNDTVSMAGGHDIAEGGAGVDLLIIDYSAVGSYGLGMGADAEGRTIFGNTASSSFSRVHYSGFENFKISGGAHGDGIVTGSGNDTLAGNDGDDHLNSGSGIDSVDGGLATDRWEANKSFTTAAITINLEAAVSRYLGQGTVRGIEALTLTTGAGADVLTTLDSFLADSLTTNAGNDRVAIAGGHDVVNAGAGAQDHLIVDYSTVASYGLGMAYDAATGSGMIGNTGSSSFSRVDFTGVEQFSIIGGSQGDSFATGAGRDVLNGGAGNDALTGGGGNDTLNGGLDNDSLSGGTGLDRILASLGHDTVDGGAAVDSLDFIGVVAGVTVDLAAGSATFSIPDSSLSIAGIERLYGTTAADELTGNGVGNVLDGRGGDDTLAGGGGNDTLIGGLGVDELDGGTGRDRFDFNAIGESLVVPAGRDLIVDFQKGMDRIDLSTIDAVMATAANEAFAFIGDAAFTATGQVRAVTAGGNTLVFINNDTSLDSDMAITLAGLSTLAGADFVL